jgi:hypothetical protein
MKKSFISISMKNIAIFTSKDYIWAFDAWKEAILDPKRKEHLERIDVPLDKKIYLLEKSINHILESGRKIVTMKELANLQNK